MNVLPDPSSLRLVADHLRRIGDSYQSQSVRLSAAGSLVSSGSWSGSAADSFKSSLQRGADQIGHARSPYYSAAEQLEAVARKVEAVAPTYERLLRERGAMPPADPLSAALGFTRMVDVDAQLRDIERQVRAQMDASAAVLRGLVQAATHADKEAHDHVWWRRAGGSILGAAKNSVHFLGSVAGGFGDATVGLGKLAWRFSDVRLMTNPRGYFADVEKFAKGDVELVRDLYREPGNTLYRTFDVAMLKNNPGRWVGEQLPAAVLSLFTGGAAGVGVKAGDTAAAATSREIATAALKDTAVAGEESGSVAAEDAAKAAGRSLTSLPVDATIERGDYRFFTDASGRVTRASGRLHLGKGLRNTAAARVARSFGWKGDHAGHLIGRRFEGPDDLVNLLPQRANLNLSAWKKMENGWAKALGDGKRVDVDIEPVYGGDGLRPDGFNVSWEIDGEVDFRFFSNIDSTTWSW